MINEVNGIRNYSASRAAMKLIYWVQGCLAAIWVMLTAARLIVGSGINLAAFLVLLLINVLLAGAVIPGYFGKSHLSMSEKDIVCIKGMITDRKIYLPMDAVKSVTMIVTPLGGRTGINLIVFNAMGSRLIVWFLDKEDCIDIYGYVNELIMSRRACRPGNSAAGD